MNREYTITIEQLVSTAYSIDRDDALELIGEEWDDEVKEKCKANKAIMDMYMTKYAQRVKRGKDVTYIEDHFVIHDNEFHDDISYIQLDAVDTNENGYETGTHEVLLEMRDEEDEDDE